MPYYTLADPAPKVGSTLNTRDGDGYDTSYITDDPRRLNPIEIFDDDPDGHETATDLVQNTTVALIRVEPVGDASADGHLYTADAWTVAGVESSIDPVLGPQASRIRDVVALAEQVLRGDEDPRALVYAKAVNERYEATKQHEKAAEAALSAISADGIYWTGCEYGWELLALAARDLIGTTPGWTQEAYDALTEPWRLAMGLPAHPEDKAPVPVA